MIFSSKLTIFLRRNNLQVFDEKGNALQELSVSTSVEKDEEIKDPAAYEKLVSDFLSKLNAKDKKIIIVLSEEVTFQKTLTTKDDAAGEKFFDSIPFAVDKLAKIVTTLDAKTLAIATNKDLFGPIVKLAKSFKFEVEAVVPQIVFGAAQNQTLTSDDIKKILTSGKLIKGTNLLNQHEQSQTAEVTVDKQQESKVEKEPQDRRKMILVAGLLLFIFLGLFLIFIALKPLLFRKPQQNLAPLQKVKPVDESQLPQSTTSAPEATQSQQ